MTLGPVCQAPMTRSLSIGFEQWKSAPQEQTSRCKETRMKEKKQNVRKLVEKAGLLQHTKTVVETTLPHLRRHLLA